jgi:hypothetical protein
MTLQLTVCKARSEDVYKDMVRIHGDNRRDNQGRPVPEGKVCQLTCRTQSAYAIVRGAGDSENKTEIAIDERQRELLGVQPGETCEFRIRKCGPWGEFRWAWRASDPAYRVAARLAVLSVGLGLLGLVLGFLGVVK